MVLRICFQVAKNLKLNLFFMKERNPKVVVRTCNGVEIRDSYGETRMSRDLGGAYR